jgi:eukaryotic-like serine/threonine-protein kinase
MIQAKPSQPGPTRPGVPGELTSTVAFGGDAPAPSLLATMAAVDAPLPPVRAVPPPDVQISYARTLAQEPDSPRSSSTAPGSVSPASLARSTVLPEVELVGDVPQLVQSTRVRYEELKLLGAGGVGEVLKVQDNDIQRPVAMKRLLPEMRSASTMVRFMSEIRTVGRLEHPNIVPIHDVGIDDKGQYFFVMKYVDGETLETIIERLVAGDADYHRRYPFTKRVQIFTGILDAMSYAHANGIIHRDIKPANIMVGPYGEVVVMDWGLAKRIRGEGDLPASLRDAPVPAAEPEGGTARGDLFKTRVGSLLGTPAYMSPEQARGQHDTLDERSDVYSLTVMFYELITLSHPLAGKNTLPDMLAAIVDEEPTFAPMLPPHPAQGGIPGELGWFFFKGLQKNPAARYQTIHEMIDRLTQRGEGNIPVQCPWTFMKRGSTGWMRLIDNHPALSLGGAIGFTLLTLASLAFSGVHLLRMVG